MFLLSLQLFVQGSDLVAQSVVEATLGRDVEREETVLTVVLVEQLHVTLDDATDSLDMSFQTEGGQTVVHPVVDDVQAHVAIECLLTSSGSQPQTEGDAHGTVLAYGVFELLGL